MTDAQWRIGDRVFEAGPRLTPLASDFADDVYKRASEVWSEALDPQVFSHLRLHAPKKVLDVRQDGLLRLQVRVGDIRIAPDYNTAATREPL